MQAEPARRAALAEHSDAYQQQHLGSILHAQLNPVLAVAYPGHSVHMLTGKVVGMLLATYSTDELASMLATPEDLFQTVADALMVRCAPWPPCARP